MDLIESEDELLPLTPPEIRELARDVELNLLPDKSRTVYEHTYSRFMEYRQKKNVGSFSENVLIAYFSDLSKKMKPSTLWSTYSMLKATLNIKNNIDLAKYLKLRAFLKRQSDGFHARKSRVFQREEIEKFLSEAPDELYLSTKVGIC